MAVRLIPKFVPLEDFRREFPISEYSEGVDDRMILSWLLKHLAPSSGGSASQEVRGPRPRAVRAPSEYGLLQTYLEDRYATMVVLTFGEIEDLLGFKLPEVASSDGTWWTTNSTPSGQSAQSKAWTLAGRSAIPNLVARTVAFERGLSS